MQHSKSIPFFFYPKIKKEQEQYTVTQVIYKRFQKE